MKKILIVMPSLYNGGAERSLVNLLNELPKDRYHIDILLLKKSGLFLSQVPNEFNVLDTPKDIKRLYGTLKDAGILMLYKIIANVCARLFTKNSREMRGYRWKHFYSSKIDTIKNEYDVALAYISGEILYFVDEKVKAKKKIVWIHNDYRSAGHPRKYDYDHLKNMDAIVSISDKCVDILYEEFPEFRNKIHMIENITSSVVIKNRSNEFVPTEYDYDTNRILSIGRLHEQKGFDLAIEAASLMKKDGVKFKWYVIGTGELEESLKQQIKRYDVEDCFILLGAKENPYPYIANSTLFVQPSRYEGKSVVLDEAKILATPILATNYPTIGDQLEDGKEGKIVSMDPNGISQGIKVLLDDKTARKNLADYLASREYGNQNEIEKYLNLLG